MPKFNPPWDGPPISPVKKKRGWFLIDNETTAEKFAQEVDRYIDGVYIKQLGWERHGWGGACMYVVANEPINEVNFRKWYIKEEEEDPLEEGWTIRFEPDLEVH